MPQFRRVLAIINPAAGQKDPARIREKIAARLKAGGVDFEIRETDGEGNTHSWARTATAEGFDLLMAAGGDGTVREAVEGLMRSGARIPLGQIPIGTGNIAARALSIPTGTEEAVDLVFSGKTVKVDIGYLPEHDKYFVFVAGAGYDARLIQATNPSLKKRIGFFAYVAAGIRQLFELKPIKVDVETDDNRLFMRAHTVMIINIGNIDNLGLAFGPDITPHDGKLNVMVLSNKTLFGTLRVFLKILTKRYYGYAKLKHFQARRIRVTASPRLPVQIDGESLTQTPFLAEVIPDALSLLVPRDYGHEERQVMRPRFLRRIFSPIER